MRLSQAAALDTGTKWKRAGPQFHTLVSSDQGSGNPSVMRATVPCGMKACRPSRKWIQAAVSRLAAVWSTSWPLRWSSAPNASGSHGERSGGARAGDGGPQPNSGPGYALPAIGSSSARQITVLSAGGAV